MSIAPRVRLETFPTITGGHPMRAVHAIACKQPGVWFAKPDVAASPEWRNALLALLSDVEHQRMARLQRESDRSVFLTAHALLRVVLARHAGIDPRAWQFCADERGRPEIAAPRGSPIRFSLAHTHGLAACAVTLHRDVGVDVQCTAKHRPIELADRLFSPRELDDLRRAPAAKRAGRFFTYWTLKEAYLKARGVGFSLPIDSFSFYRGADGRWRIMASQDDDGGRWKFWSWRIGAQHRAALAVCAATADSKQEQEPRH